MVLSRDRGHHEARWRGLPDRHGAAGAAADGSVPLPARPPGRAGRRPPVRLDRGHPYRGDRPHANAELSFRTAEQAAALLRDGRQPDLAAGLVDLARRRLPHWADRIWQGNAIDWTPPEARRFDYVHVLLDCVPPQRRADLIRHHLSGTVRPGTGRLLVSDYSSDPGIGSPTAAQTLRSLGFACDGQTSSGQRPGRPPAPTAWIDASPRTNI